MKSIPFAATLISKMMEIGTMQPGRNDETETATPDVADAQHVRRIKKRAFPYGTRSTKTTTPDMGEQESEIAQQLRRKCRYFIGTRRRGRNEVVDFARRLAGLGPVAITGAMLRELALDGNRRFAAPIDLLAQPSSIDGLRDLIDEKNGIASSDDCFEVALDRWSLRLKAVPRPVPTPSPAASGGIDDMWRQAFFDWDAIVLNMSTGTLSGCPGWFQRLQSNVVGILHNRSTDPDHDALQALRWACTRYVGFTPDLARFVTDHIRKTGAGRLKLAERRLWRDPQMHWLDLEKTRAQLDARLDLASPAPIFLIKPPFPQYRLAIS